MKETLAKITEFWQKLSRIQQISMGIGAFGVLILVGVSAVFLGSEKYVPLFDYIKDRREALGVQSKLIELGFKVKSSEGGHIISVMKGKVEAAHLALAESNSLPDAIPSYEEILDTQSSFGLTEKELVVRINRAKEGKIARTIMQYRNVKRADVTIEMAQDVLFVEDQKDTTVSVLITMENALETMAAPQVRTTLNLISKSVLGVEDKNVHISDDKGNDLVALLKAKTKELSHYEKTRRKETELRRKAEQTLAEIYGEENIGVQVDVVLNFDEKEVEAKELKPPVKGEDQGVTISEEKKEHDTKTTDPKAIPGTTTNIPGYQAPDPTLTASMSKEQRINRAYNTKKTVIKHAIGLIKRLTVSVVINQAVLSDKILSEEEREKVIHAVAKAIGLDTIERRDEISVQAFVFNRIKFESLKRREKDYKDFEAKLASVAVIAFLSAVFLGIYRYYRRLKIQRQRKTLEMAQRAIAEQQEVEEEVLTVEQKERNERERFLMEMARENPDELVKTIRSFMMEESYY
ncbi:flagellar M-ring protein FliF [bacterium]|nr:flagellar M-ring protein FliF [bacterium]